MADRISDGSLDQLRTFLAVYRAGSITAGARAVGLSQSTVTSQIQALEQQSGRQLFDRVARGVRPTTVADDLAARVAAPLDDLALALAGSTPSAPPEPVHLAGPAELMAVRVLPGLASLVARGVRLRITTGLADDLLEGLRQGRFDLLVSPVRPRGRTLSATPLTDEEFVLVAAGPLDVETAPLIAYAEDVPIVRRYWRHVFGRRLTLRPAVVIPDLRGVLAAVVAGAGWSVLPRYLCEAELASGTLILLRDPDDPPINTGFLVQRSPVLAGTHPALVRESLLRSGPTW
ncbi:LysR family transcriptional regulator [Actinoplanes sp. TRM 88003]|uniref:LysR family transcriptional regulator n=1 Tax=Paractinoplanes aksuensis TaxID=2939490 RepID=A0ABT1DSN3_9ACTN|nr:LysR family transcriptional regulator [Actinoplanes aksuensis]MCO8273852.1 LysR family transcriptional regulator [Actinoplanes aksuensis]